MARGKPASRRASLSLSSTIMSLLHRLRHRLTFSARHLSTKATPSPTPPRPPRQTFLTPYLTLLRARYPSADPASLIASFLILHELTAIIPLFGFFSIFKTFGVGVGLAGWAVAEAETDTSEPSWARGKVRGWVQEGEEQAEKIGRRYGVFGFEKESKEERVERREREKVGEDSVQRDYKVTGDVANLVAAYIATKVSSLTTCLRWHSC